jgi:hypothetical protein
MPKLTPEQEKVLREGLVEYAKQGATQDELDQFASLFAEKAAKGANPVGGATSGQGSNAPTKPSTSKIAELTSKATMGDSAAIAELAALKAATSPKKKEQLPIPSEADLLAVEGKEVGKVEPTTPFVAPKTKSLILSKEKVLEAAEKGVYEENKADVDLYKQTATSPKVDVVSMVQSTLSDDANTRIESESNLEQYYKGLEFDYKKYLESKGDNESIEKYNQLSSLPAEDRDETDELFLRSFREKAVEKNNVANMVRLTELKNSVNLDDYDKQTAKLSAEYTNLRNNNSEAAILRKQQIAAEMQAVIEQTGVTEEVASELNSLKRNVVAGDALAMKSGAGFTKIAAQEQEQKKELEDRAEAISSSNPLVFAPALAKEMINAYSGAVGKGVLSTLQVPKVLGDFLGDNDYGVVDRLYDWSEGVMQERKGTFDRVENFDKLPDFVQLPIMFSEGIGSVVQFAAGGEAAQAAKIPVMVGTFGTSFLTTEAMYYKEAIESGMDRKDAAKSATFIAATTSLIESMIPDLKYFEPSAYRKSIIDLMKKGLSSEQAAKELMPTVIESLGTYTKVGAKEGGEEFLGALGENGAKALVNSVTGQTNYVGLQNPENYTTPIIIGFATGAGANVMARPQAQRTNTQERVLYEAALNKDEVIYAIEEQAPQNAPMAKTVEMASDALQGLESLPSFPTLDEEVKAHVTSETVRKKQLEQAVKETGVDESVVASEVENINENVKYALENNAIRGEEKKVVKGEEETPSPTMEWSGEEVKIESPINQTQEAENEVNVAQVGQNEVENTPIAEQQPETVQPVEEVVAAPQEGASIELPPQVKGAMPTVMVFKDGTWQQKVGGTTTRVSEAVQQKAQEAFANVKQAPVVKQVVETPVAETPKENNALKDVESTTKALEESVDLKKIKRADLLSIVQDFAEISDPSINGFDKQIGIGWNKADKNQIKSLQDAYVNSVSTEKAISEAYHKAKADGSNPELVKAVEDLLVGSEQETIAEQAPANELFAAIDNEIAQTDKGEIASIRKANKERFGDTYKKAVQITKNFNDIVKRLEKEGVLTKECP